MTELTTSGLFSNTMVAKNTTTGAWFSTFAVPLDRPQITDLRITITHKLDGTTLTTITTTTTPNTLILQHGLTSASLVSYAERVTTAQPPLTQLIRMNDGDVFTTPEFNINSTIQHMHAGEADVTSHGLSYTPNTIPTSHRQNSWRRLFLIHHDPHKYQYKQDHHSKESASTSKLTSSRRLRYRTRVMQDISPTETAHGGVDLGQHTWGQSRLHNLTHVFTALSPYALLFMLCLMLPGRGSGQ